MIEGGRGIVLRQVGALFRAGTFAGMSDGQLLDHFLARKGEAGELAFAVLVERHGPMVLRVCRGVLGDRHDAEDAFQATFLALVRGAGSIRRRDSVACWLHGAALRVAACARSAGARRRRHEGRSAAKAGDSARDRGIDDLGAVLHEEVGRLPARYRAAVLLCDLEGLSLVEAARHLGCPVGTVKSRVARGRERLRDRLVRRGVVPTTASAVGVALARESRAAVRPALAEASARLAVRFARGRGTAGMLVSPAEWLARLDHRRLLMARLRSMTAALATIGVLAAGATLLGQQLGGGGRGSGGSSSEAKETRGDGSTTKLYSVADLLTATTAPDGSQTKYDMGPLIDLLASTVAPGTWTIHDEKGNADGQGRRPGSIIPFHASLSLVVRHTPEVQDQFEERVLQLRRVFVSYESSSAMNGPRIPPPAVLSGAPAVPGTMGGMPGMAGAPAIPASGGMMKMMGQAAQPGMAQGGMMGSTSGPKMGATFGAARKGTDARVKSRAMMGATAQPGAAAGGMPGMPGAPPMIGPGAAGSPGEVQATTPSPGANPDGQLVPYGVSSGPRPGGPAQYDVNVMYPVGADGKPVARLPAPREAETERRLRSLEEKLDRVLKALDAPRVRAAPGRR